MLPFLVFVVFYLGLSLQAGDFYKVPMPIAFVVASASALFLNLRKSLSEKVTDAQMTKEMLIEKVLPERTAPSHMIPS